MENPEPLSILALSFLHFSRHKVLEQYWPRLRTCVESLTDQQVWWRPNASSNSVGNLILHLDGNVRQWIVATFSGASDMRERSAEFEAKGDMPSVQLLGRLEETLREADHILSRLADTKLGARYEIQGYTVTGLEAVYHVVEHFALHYGQVLYVTKLLRNDDLGFYRTLNDSGRATGSETTLA